LLSQIADIKIALAWITGTIYVTER